MDRRAAFFAGAALLSMLLIPITEQQHRWVPSALAAVYLLLALASWADRRTRVARVRSRGDRPAANRRRR
jgi:hypothetical protein